MSDRLVPPDTTNRSRQQEYAAHRGDIIHVPDIAVSPVARGG